MINTDVLRLEVADTPPAGAIINLIQNPSGEKGGFGWVTPVSGSNLRGTDNGTRLTYSAPASVPNFFYTENYPVTVGQSIGASWVVQSCIIGAGGSGWYRAKIEFLNVSNVVIGSTAYSAYLQKDIAINQKLAASTVPASTATARLRFEMYSTNTGTNIASSGILVFFRCVMATAATSGALSRTTTNLVTNPSIETNTTGWNALAGTTYARVSTTDWAGSWSLECTNTGNDGIWTTQSVTLPSAGRYAVTSYLKGEGVSAFVFPNFTGQTVVQEATVVADGNGWGRSVAIIDVPAGTTGTMQIRSTNVPTVGEIVRVDAAGVFTLLTGDVVPAYFDGDTTDTLAVTYAWTGTANASTSTAVEYLPFTDGTWTDVLGPTHEIKLSREALNVGLLTATILDSTLDPATADTLRPGKDVRLRVLEHGIIDGPTVTNLMRNPSAEVDVVGWSTYAGSVARVTTQHDSGVAAIEFTVAGFDNGFADNRTQNIPVTAGMAYSVSARFKSAVTPRVCNVFVFWKSSDTADLASIGSSAGATITSSTSAWTLAKLENAVAPVGATHMMVCCQISSLTASEIHYIDSVIAVQGTTVPTYFDGATADTADALYEWSGTADASTSIKTPQVFGERGFTSLFEGSVTHAQTTYDLARTDERQARIELVAADNIRQLANVSRTEGVGTIDELRYLMEGAGVPWIVNGDSNQVSTAVVVAKNENASLVDQISITRDTSLGGVAWVNRSNVLVAQDVAHMNYAEVTTLDESVYSDMDVSFNTDDCINDVRIKWLRYTPATGGTEEVTYGPYRDLTSIATWGYHSKEFTMQGAVESTPTIDSYAAYILNANSDPVVRVNSVQIPILATTDLTTEKALLDLYDLVRLQYTPKALNHTSRITGVEHVFTPTIPNGQGGWLMNVTFSTEGVVASPQATPSPTTDATASVPVVPVSQGGTGLSTVAAGNYLSGNGTANMSARTPAQVRTDIGAAPSVHQHAGTDITTGTVADARLPSTMANKTFTGTTTIGGEAIAAMQFGAASGTTNASGQLTVTHGLGVTPVAILLGNMGFLVRIQSITSTTFTVECRLPTTSAVAASVAVTFSWMAIA